MEIQLLKTSEEIIYCKLKTSNGSQLSQLLFRRSNIKKNKQHYHVRSHFFCFIPFYALKTQVFYISHIFCQNEIVYQSLIRLCCSRKENKQDVTVLSVAISLSDQGHLTWSRGPTTISNKLSFSGLEMAFYYAVP